jgi:hypothetical protein
MEQTIAMNIGVALDRDFPRSPYKHAQIWRSFDNADEPHDIAALLALVGCN